MNIFNFNDYKEIIREKIKENKHLKAYKTNLAMLAGCQKSFFSQVLSTHIHFTPDHAARLTEIWHFNESEADYFILLLMQARAGNSSLKNYLQKKIDKLIQLQGQPSERLYWPSLDSPSSQLQYYSSWYWSAIHILVSVPEMTSANEIASHLKLPMEIVLQALQWLEEKKLIVKKNTGWSVTDTFIHLNSRSPMNETHQSNWLHKAIADLQKQNSDSLHYSSVFTIDEATFQNLKRTLVDSIEKMTPQILASPSKKLVCLSTHLFPIG